MRSQLRTQPWTARLALVALILAMLTSLLAAPGRTHAAAAGTIAAWGNNDQGQLNMPAGLNNAIALAGGVEHSMALRSDGTVVAWGGNAFGQTAVPAGLNMVRAIAAGDFHSLALKADGTVVNWGGQTALLAVPAGLNNVAAISAGSRYSLALKSDGTVVAWGDISSGQLNPPAGLNNVIAIAAGGTHSLALKSDGTVVAWGSNGPQSTVPAGLNNVAAIAAGEVHSLALKRDGSVVAWGVGSQATVPAGLGNVIMIAAGNDHSLALRGDGSLVTWGNDTGGPLAIPAGLNNIVSIAAGHRHSLALRADSSVVTGWGYNDGTLNFPAGLTNVKAVSAGSFNSLALKSNGTVVAWGSPDANAGQNNVPAGLGNVIAISAPGYDHNYALTAGGRVVGWGDNTFGQLNIPSGLGNVKDVSAGDYQGLALKADGTVAGWGDGSAGQLNIPSGLNNVAAISMGSAHSVVLKADGTVATWGDSSGGQLNLPSGLNNVIAVAAGGLHTLALKSDGTVVAWGNNRSGQLNVPAGLNNVIAIAAGGEFSVALKADGSVVAWGTNFYGETRVPAGLNNVTAISGGAAFSLALYAAEATPPTSNATTNPANPNVNGWFRSNVTVNFSATDNPGGSGVRSITYSASGAQTAAATVNGASASLVISANGTTTISYYATDNLGNVEAAKTLTIRLDSIAPTVTASADRAPNAAGWYTAPVTYSFSGVDAAGGAGGVTCEAPETYSGPDSASASVTGGCFDAAGNVGAATVSLKYDATRPTITASARNADGSNYTTNVWTNQNVTVSFSCADTTSGIAAGACPGPVTLSTDVRNFTVNASVSDRAGNSASISFGPISIDKTGPIVTATPDRDPNGAGWYRTPVSFSFSGVDAGDGAGFGNCNPPKLFTGPDSATATITGSCIDLLANVGSTTATFKYDATRPTLTVSAKKADGSSYTAGSWTNQSVTISFSCADATSGIAGACPAPITVSAEGVTPPVSASISDRADNSTSVSFGPIQIDRTAPDATATLDRAPDSNDWYNAPVTVSFSGTDNAGAAGSVTCNAAKTYSGPDSNSASVTGSCSDAAGNSSSATASFKYDATAPTISAAAASSPNANGWYNGDVSVAFSCADALAGIAAGGCPANQTLTGEGAAISSTAQTVSDLAGNSATSNAVTVQIDRTAPTITAATASSPNANGWYNGDVTVAFSCADALSGLAGACPASQTLTGEGTSISSTAQTASDLAGNSATSNIVTVKIDRTAPAVSVTGVIDGATYTLGSVPAAGCSTTDALSGVATQASLTRSAGSLGLVTVTCSGAIDNAGNAAPAVSLSYRVAYSFLGFFQPVDNLPTVNTATAGRTVPLKWRVVDAAGNPITNLTSVSVTSVAGGCSASAPADTLEEYATTNTGLMNQGNGYYQFNWQTERAWAGSCRTLRLDLGDGVVRTALFQFR